jgi:glycogen synthase
MSGQHAGSPFHRILMTADAVGGVWTYSVELAAALASKGSQIILATMGNPLAADQRKEVSDIPGVTLCESSFKLEWMDNPWADVDRASQWLLDLETRLRPDMVHLNGYVHAALPWAAPKIVAAHSCVFSWWEAVKGGTPPRQWDLYRQKVTEGLNCADHVVCPSHAMLQMLNRYYGPLPSARVIPNGRTPARFITGEKETLILGVGRIWDPAKNVESLDAVASRLPWPVYLAGDCTRPDGQPTCLSNVRLLGRLSSMELATWLAKASIFAMPARYEPFGLAILEAALSSCALVLGDIPSLRELWEGAALFAPPGDLKALEDQLRFLMFDDRSRTAGAKRARERALTFGPERMAMNYLQAYHEATRNLARRQAVDRAAVTGTNSDVARVACESGNNGGVRS